MKLVGKNLGMAPLTRGSLNSLLFMVQPVTPQLLIAKWKRADLAESAACREHFLDLRVTT
jgi:hypothetical protein